MKWVCGPLFKSGLHIRSPFSVWMLLSKHFLSFCHFLNNIKPFCCYSYLLKISIMVLTQSQCRNISKEELNQELTEINSSFVNDINRKLTNCLISLTNLHQNMINWYLHRKSILSCSKTETIELKPVPAEIHEDVLKESIYKAL